MDFENVGDDGEVWEKVLHKLGTGQMPPVGMPRPDAAAATAFVVSLETAIDREAAASPNPGRVAVHRLNRTEYANAVRDVLALEVDARSLPLADEANEEGFDNIAGILSVSPALMESYLSAAHKISRLAVGDPTIVPASESYKIPLKLVQDDWTNEDLPFGSRGVAIRHRFPLDGEYVIKVRLRRQIYNYIVGLGARQLLDVRVDGTRVRRFAVGVGNEDMGTTSPHTWVGHFLGDPEWERYMHHADDGLEVRVPVRAGTRVVGVSFVNSLYESEGVIQAPQIGFGAINDAGYEGNAAVDSVTIDGPYATGGSGDTPSRRKIFVCHPSGDGGRSGDAGLAAVEDEEACAQAILSTLARRAYRRPVTDGDVETLISFFRTGRRQGGFETGIQLALERLLVDPDFLFRIERDPESVRRAPSIASATWSWPLGCHSFSGAVFLTTSSWTWPFAGSSKIQGSWTSRYAACSAIPDRRRWWTISRASG